MSKSDKLSVEEIQRLVHDIAVPFYLIDRDMDIQLSDKQSRKETDAEHAWSLALVACAVAPRIDDSLDVGKIAQLAIVHDLVEIHAGDVSIWADDNALEAKEENEAKALQKLAKDFASFPWLIENITEYEEKSSNEALFVYAVDKLIPFFFRILVKPTPFERKKLKLEQFRTGIQRSRRKAQSHPVIGRYFDEMLDMFLSHPEYFYSQK